MEVKQQQKAVSSIEILTEEGEATALRKLCEKHITEHPDTALEHKQLVARDALVRRWAKRRAPWNVEQGGMTLAEIWFMALCYQQMAVHPPGEMELQAMDGIRLYDHMKELCRRKAGAPGINTELFDQVAYLVVFELSHGLDLKADEAAQQHFDSRAEELKALNKKTRLAKRADSDSIAGNAILGFIPLAARTFWHAWADEMVSHNAEDVTIDAKEASQFNDWMKQQFAMPTQQAFRLDLTELFYKDHVPMGGHTFHQRGAMAVGESLPGSTLVQMELTQKEQELLSEALDDTVPDMEAKADHPARSMAIVHMFRYTFANRMQKGDKPFLFDLVYKWDIPERLAELQGPMLKWGRPLRPIVVQTQTGWYVHHVQCTCSPTTVTCDHRDGPTSCVLRRQIFRCANESQALVKWLSLMKHEFRDTLACGTSTKLLSDEVFGEM